MFTFSFLAQAQRGVEGRLTGEPVFVGSLPYSAPSHRRRPAARVKRKKFWRASCDLIDLPKALQHDHATRRRRARR